MLLWFDLAKLVPADRPDFRIIVANLPLRHAKVQDAELGHIRMVLTHCEGSVGKTADVLGISRKTPWKKMKRLEINAWFRLNFFVELNH